MADKPLTSTRALVERLDANQELWRFEAEIDPNLELAEVQRLVSAKKGPAILFTKVKGTKFPVATNLYGSTRRMDLAFGDRPKRFIEELAQTALNLMPPTPKKLWAARGLALEGIKVGLKNKSTGPVLAGKIEPVDLTQLPQLKSWPEDGGPFVTLPLVYTQSPKTGKGNLGMYRIQLFDQTTTGMHIQIHRGGGYHLHEAEGLNQPLPARIFVGGPPALTLAAVAPLPEDIPELVFASLLMGQRLEVGTLDSLKIRMALEADFMISGLIPPHQRRPEGPFGDHYGYYSLQHDYPFLQVQSLHHRKDAIWPATVVGRPPQEDHYIAEYLQELLEPLFPLVMHQIKKVWAFEESGVHSLAGALVKNRYPKEAFTAALRILSEGQLSLTKFLLVTDQEVNVKDFRALITKILERADLRTDLFVLSNIAQDTLDYTGPKVNEGSKAILMGLGEKKRELAPHWEGPFVEPRLLAAHLFCPGVLCVGGVPYDQAQDLGAKLALEPSIQGFSWVVLLDDPKAAAQSNEDFVWHCFTRFEPAADLYGAQRVERFHVGIEGPLVIDARMKPWYPKALTPDPEVAARVQEKWGQEIDRVCKG
ncbi:MAG: 4-hydroxybenzoate decarboxylase [Candidatus Lambdaproteobacteria bacterium RIFOXYD1_FULL_56_27]|uniref:4-hydroxybenzoate decarboxylase n=1 Tax=Candidatus Lambdaproteobacteria bacterium RIFOXYD2_FULL_56_26 TaxID=1817773 RepID=A0A1F6GZ84_9PROT|nr:MAG: 4-hydroxybenzoate decarboxylase [Candidatus Lambdaproteobacteria bacterium RIFOXYC1_FULL_56_13]OGH03458.1 MAG: 4-hydroxybenzoate decarboxylase [Candidatus Lambdaproteobacteria bacterium RIFOXYD2_FULL_56_26]OGH08243.1 MAG: 4-hydroxybenzoate decarboxylase [Candidatus Lambdaproteobacteria bacterium RIFOXYD1_FULL_56_27]